MKNTKNFNRLFNYINEQYFINFEPNNIEFLDMVAYVKYMRQILKNVLKNPISNTIELLFTHYQEKLLYTKGQENKMYDEYDNDLDRNWNSCDMLFDSENRAELICITTGQKQYHTFIKCL